MACFMHTLVFPSTRCMHAHTLRKGRLYVQARWPVRAHAQVCEWLPVVEMRLQRPYLPRAKPSAAAAAAGPQLSAQPKPLRTPPPVRGTHETLASALQQQQHLACANASATKDGFEPSGGDAQGAAASGADDAEEEGFWEAAERSWGEAGEQGQKEREGEEGEEEEEEGWLVEVDLWRLRGGRGASGKRGRPRAYAPRFPKVRLAVWLTCMSGDAAWDCTACWLSRTRSLHGACLAEPGAALLHFFVGVGI